MRVGGLSSKIYIQGEVTQTGNSSFSRAAQKQSCDPDCCKPMVEDLVKPVGEETQHLVHLGKQWTNLFLFRIFLARDCGQGETNIFYLFDGPYKWLTTLGPELHSLSHRSLPTPGNVIIGTCNTRSQRCLTPFNCRMENMPPYIMTQTAFVLVTSFWMRIWILWGGRPIISNNWKFSFFDLKAYCPSHLPILNCFSFTDKESLPPAVMLAARHNTVWSASGPPPSSTSESFAAGPERLMETSTLVVNVG